MYIANFVPFKYAKNIITISEYESNSTFALRSLRSCQILEEIEGDTTVGDAEEGKVTYRENGKKCFFETGNPIMVSCWTKIKNEYVTEEDWMDLYEKGSKDKFARTDGIVIVSTVDKVRKFMTETIAPSFLEQNITSKDDHVIYGEPTDTPKNNDKILWAPFVKRERYRYQREYRFAFCLPCRCQFEKITCYIENPADYIDRIQFGPEMKRQNKRELLGRAFGTFVRLIPDFDELQKDIRKAGTK